MKYVNMLLLAAFCTGWISCAFYEKDSAYPAGGEEPFTSAVATPGWYDPGSVDTVTVVTWNVEHFVDEYDNPYIKNDRENRPRPGMELKRRLFAEALRRMDADIVVLQEFESDSYASHLAETRFPDLGYKVFSALESEDWYMNVVMMSRIPAGMFYSYADIYTPVIGQKDSLGNVVTQSFINNRMWSADILVNSDYSFTLSALHLKAGRGDRNRGWRLGQINLLRAHLLKLHRLDPNRNMVIMGDLNTTPGSEEFNVLLGRESGLTFTDPLAGTGSYTHPSDSLFWRIDHILPNTGMAGELIPNSVTVARPLPDSSMAKVSDHLPVLARFIPKNAPGKQ